VSCFAKTKMFRSELPFKFLVVTLLILNLVIVALNHYSIVQLENRVVGYFEIPLPDWWVEDIDEQH